MYETERLTQDLYKNEIDIRNIVVNQVLFDEGDCNMCKSRIKMQKKYLDQIRDLFDDFHITILPLQTQEVRGFNDLTQFSGMLLDPPIYKY
jgi:arsenite-transporting ATPase